MVVGVLPQHQPPPNLAGGEMKRNVWAIGYDLTVMRTHTLTRIVTAALLLAGCSSNNDPAADTNTKLWGAHNKCSTGKLEDSDHTLVIDMPGEDEGSGTATQKGFNCTVDELRMPAAVMAKMMDTRALDGMQSDRWGAFEATWTYHPDDGLDVILTEK